MLDHDDGLLDDEFSEEQTDPAFIQELRAISQLRPEEKQVLARVHERLARTAVSPSEFEPPPTGRADTAFAPQASSSLPWHGQGRYGRLLSTVAAVFFVGLLVGSLVLTFATLHGTRNVALHGIRNVALPNRSHAAVKTLVTLSSGLRLAMLNEQVGWAIGDHKDKTFSSVLRTTDGGKHWQEVTPPGKPDMSLSFLYLLDEKVAWCNCYRQVTSAQWDWLGFLRTIDGGRTWQQVTMPPDGADIMVTFLDQNHGWGSSTPLSLHGGPGLPSEVKAKFHFTKDGGKTWGNNQNTPDSYFNGDLPVVKVSSLQFLDDKTGWMTGLVARDNDWQHLLAALYITHDGGRTWIPRSLPAPPGRPAGEKLTALSLLTAFNQREGYLLASFADGKKQLSIYKTQDGGNTWQPIGDALPGGDQYEIQDTRHTFAMVDPSYKGPLPPRMFLQILDGEHILGETMPNRTLANVFLLTLVNGRWKQTNISLPGKGTVEAVSFGSTSMGLVLRAASPQSFDLYRTIDGGRTWQNIGTLPKSSNSGS